MTYLWLFIKKLIHPLNLTFQEVDYKETIVNILYTFFHGRFVAKVEPYCIQKFVFVLKCFIIYSDYYFVINFLINFSNWLITTSKINQQIFTNIFFLVGLFLLFWTFNIWTYYSRFLGYQWFLAQFLNRTIYRWVLTSN